jgi:chromate transport protein ChrA
VVGEEDSGVAGEPAADRTGRVRDVALVFLRLGTIAFGGPAAHIAMMREEFVRRRGWLTDQRFVDLLGATNLIPGRIRPNLRSTLVMSRRGGGA